MSAESTPVRLAPFDKRLIEIRPENVVAAVREANKLRAENLIEGVNILGFVATSIDALSKLVPMERIHLQSCEDIDVSPLYEAQKDIGRLVITSSPVPVDLTKFPGLHGFSGFWHRKSSGLDALRRLETLALWKLDARFPDVASLGLAPTVHKLWFTQSNIVSLEGIGQLKKMAEVQLAYLRKPIDLGALGELKKLVKIDLQHLAQPENLERLGECKSLDQIDIDHCGSVASIKWLAGLTKLTSFVITDTKVVDGDFSVIRKLSSLEHFVADNRREYKPPIKELEALVEARGEK